MQESSMKIEMKCPFCKMSNYINIPESILSQKKSGSIKINIPKGAICPEHNFVAYITPEGKVVGLEKIDIEMSNKAEESSEDLEKITLRTLVQDYGIDGLKNMMHAKIFGYRCYILKDYKDISASMEINEFFNNMMPETFRNLSIDFIIKNEYERMKTKYQDSLFIDPKINNIEIPWDDKIKYEEYMVNKALDILNEGEQLVLFQHEIKKLFDEANYIVNLVEDSDSITESQIAKELSKYFLKPKIKSNYLKLLLKLVNQRHGQYIISKIKGKIAKSFIQKL